MPTGFVAREPELNFLDSCLHGVERSQSIGILISGQPGVGKTSLVEEFYHRAVSRDFLVCRCFLGDSGRSSPFEMWRIAIHEWIVQAERRGESDSVRELISEPWQTLPGLAPDDFARFGWRLACPGTQRRDPRIDSIEQQLSEEILLFIRGATSRLPTVLIVDNLQNGDRDSLGLLKEVSPDVFAVPAMFLATFRPGNPGPHNPVQSLIPALEGPADMHVISLGPFSVRDVQQYLCINGMPHDEETAAALHAASGGIPLALSRLNTCRSPGTLPAISRGD